jgi:hypothetical protein
MTKEEAHNRDAFKKFLDSPDGKDSKIFCILSINDKGNTKVFQSAVFSPKQLAEGLFRIANQIIQSVKKPN